MTRALRNIGEIGDDEPVKVDAKLAQEATRARLKRFAESLKPPAAPPSPLPLWLHRLALQTRKNARVRAISYELTDKDLLALMKRSDGRCELSGIPFCHKAFGQGRRNPFRPSIDRKDNSAGYTKKNVRLVCSLANLAMNDWGEKPLLVFAKALVKRSERTG